MLLVHRTVFKTHRGISRSYYLSAPRGTWVRPNHSPTRTRGAASTHQPRRHGTRIASNPFGRGSMQEATHQGRLGASVTSHLTGGEAEAKGLGQDRTGPSQAAGKSRASWFRGDVLSRGVLGCGWGRAWELVFLPRIPPGFPESLVPDTASVSVLGGRHRPGFSHRKHTHRFGFHEAPACGEAGRRCPQLPALPCGLVCHPRHPRGGCVLSRSHGGCGVLTACHSCLGHFPQRSPFVPPQCPL